MVCSENLHAERIGVLSWSVCGAGRCAEPSWSVCASHIAVGAQTNLRRALLEDEKEASSRDGRHTTEAQRAQRTQAPNQSHSHRHTTSTLTGTHGTRRRPRATSGRTEGRTRDSNRATHALTGHTTGTMRDTRVGAVRERSVTVLVGRSGRRRCGNVSGHGAMAQGGASVGGGHRADA